MDGEFPQDVRFLHVLEHVIDEPLLAHPDKALTVAGVVLREARVQVNVANIIKSPVNAPRAGPLQERALSDRLVAKKLKPFLFDLGSGIAVIEVTGSLAHRQWYVGNSSGIMGYDGIGAQFQAALEDPQVRGIVFDIHSAGGEVAGAFQLADRIAAARKKKPMLAIADEMAFSAAYLLAAATGEVWLASPVAQVGSVGVVVVHLSFEQMLAKEGVKPTIIQAGAQKADGNPFQDLPDDVRARFQQRIDLVHREFVTRIARWTGQTVEAVRATEAGTFMGQAAVSARLATGIAEPVKILTAFSEEIAQMARMGNAG